MIRSRGNRALKAMIEFSRAHTIPTVIGILIFAWFIVSFAVYRAEFNAEGANITTYGKALWWGVVTFLTVGYGDFVPVTITGRIWAGVLMFTGVIGVAIITAKISSYIVEQALREGRGVVTTSKLKDHFVVCGWKEDMHEILKHILAFNPGMSASELVVVASLDQAGVDNLREDPELKGLQVVVGEYYQAVNLQRAAPERAKKVMILADRTPGLNGVIPSVTEVDARTIMTAMTLSNIARGTLVTAEIIDPKMDQYLKLAHVSEIVYSREYSRLLLGNASGGTGIANIIYDLLDPKTATLITTLPVPETLLHQTYPDFKQKFEDLFPASIVIGILENTGNSQRIKETALRQAQKTPDVSKLVQNLKMIKDLKCNRPVFNPGKNYLIPEGAMAIVVRTRNEDEYEVKDAGPSENHAVA